MPSPALRRLPVIAYALAAAIIVVDQITKSWVLSGLQLQLGRPLEVLPIFNLTLVYNRGVSFGLFQSPEGQEAIRWTLAVFSLVVALGLIVWVRKAVKPLTAVAIGLIIGGALGNLIDRVRFGYVVDFLDFSGLHFPWVFNVADSGITIGVALLLAETLLTPDKAKTPSQ
jgi:signal peptidase II